MKRLITRHHALPGGYRNVGFTKRQPSRIGAFEQVYNCPKARLDLAGGDGGMDRLICRSVALQVDIWRYVIFEASYNFISCRGKFAVLDFMTNAL
ncbi:MAG TPA: hypothetical protein VKU01_04555 [Bryobacteraceae bacterium]|nr:hypothetical protein [Bryobacteraceae bacterium]